MAKKRQVDEEAKRLRELEQGKHPWKRWGPFLSDRQWATVREDYSRDGDVWEYFPFSMAQSRPYRWGEDGIGGISDNCQLLCFALAFWNGRDPILKERLFGLTGPQGNHGEDVKECYYYLDNTPTHSYMKMLYKYPHGSFPYTHLIEENARRTRRDPEFELIDTGIFDEDRYFDIFIEYAKQSPEDIGIRITVCNRGPEAADVHLLPHLWFRNTWSWGEDDYKPVLRSDGHSHIAIEHQHIGVKHLYCEGEKEILFCDNDTNAARLFGAPTEEGRFKDGIGQYIVGGKRDAVSTVPRGTKSSVHFTCRIAGGSQTVVTLRLCDRKQSRPLAGMDALFSTRKSEADEFYARRINPRLSSDVRDIHRQALSGLLWSKQYYEYDVSEWLTGDPAQPAPPSERLTGRNSSWIHIKNADVIQMPDKWEFPWYASWDLAFHCVTLAAIDPQCAKSQLAMLTHDWYIHPNGQFPAYEWAFSDGNPPVQAWAAWHVYCMEKNGNGGQGDTEFLKHVFHRLLLNFTWWVNRKDVEGHNVFQGGFLGLDNVGVFDRNMPLPDGGHIEQADGTSWMAMYALDMMRIALELAQAEPVYQDMATKFFEHFLYIAGAMVNIGGRGINLWDEEDEFFYDVIHDPDGSVTPVRLRSVVGLVPFFAVEVLEPALLKKVPEFKKRLEWFLSHRPELADLVSHWHIPGHGDLRLLSLLRGHRMKRLLARMLDPGEFLSDHGLRSLSKVYKDRPFTIQAGGKTLTVDYEPAESTTGLFGGNSNWRGPVWFPVNYMTIEALRKFHMYYGDDFRIEFPVGSGKTITLREVADELSRRLMSLFLRDGNGNRPVLGSRAKLQADPNFRDYIPFHEYFHGDTGEGLGASHQTGWTALVARLIGG